MVETLCHVANNFEFSRQASIHIPFSPEARLSLVHVIEVARMIVTLIDSAREQHYLQHASRDIESAEVEANR